MSQKLKCECLKILPNIPRHTQMIEFSIPGHLISRYGILIHELTLNVACVFRNDVFYKFQGTLSMDLAPILFYYSVWLSVWFNL